MDTDIVHDLLREFERELAQPIPVSKKARRKHARLLFEAALKLESAVRTFQLSREEQADALAMVARANVRVGILHPERMPL